MNKHKWIHRLVTLLVLVSMLMPTWETAAAHTAVPEHAVQTASNDRVGQNQDNDNLIQDFAYLGQGTGWLWLGSDLYFTEDAGANWRTITPPHFQDVLASGTFFLNTTEGWVFSALAGENGAVYQIDHTEDGGRSWQTRSLPLPQSDNPYPAAMFPYFLDAQNGWLVLKWPSGSAFSIGSLFRTGDGGATWEEVSIPTGNPVVFSTSQRGWLAGGPEEDEFYTTEDGGRSWEPVNLVPDARRYWLPAFDDALHGVTAVRTPKGVTLYATEDGGSHWQEQTSIPLTEAETPAVALTSPDVWMVTSSTESKRQMFSPRSLAPSTPDWGDWGIPVAATLTSSGEGWALYQDQDCNTEGAIISCHQQQTLAFTPDNGVHWTPLRLPDGRTRIFVSTQTVFNLTPTGNGKTAVMHGQGFDKCGRVGYSQLRTWWYHGHYKTLGFYLGGSHVGCSNYQYSASAIAKIGSLGWKFAPIWVGPQSHGWHWKDKHGHWHGCGYSCISNDTTAAYNQGIAEANKAINAAINLGLANPDGSGTVIYYDIEAFSGTATYLAAAKAFINGWTYGIHQKGSLAGIYTSSRRGHIADFASIPNVPDAAWPAAWIKPYKYRKNATVWNVPYLSNGLWSHHQRIRQYAGGHNETYKGVTLYIDSDVLDGIVVDLSAPDTAKPHTTLNLNGQPNNWPTWFDTAVEVHLHASDQGGSGVKEIHYRLDGGAWQTHTGRDVTFTVPDNGNHTLDYYAKDKAGNQESTHTAAFGVDTAPPSAPGAISEGHGIASGVWQSGLNDPAFTWGAASDSGSGVYYYRVQWGDTLQFVTGTSYDPPPVRSGSYTLSVQAVDHAGNIGPAATFTFDYDGTPPHAPEIHNEDGVSGGVWQNQVRTPNFTWPVPADEGSGVAGYYLYWGTDPNGTGTTLTSTQTFASGTPVAAPGDAAAYYLRLRSQDNVGLQSEWVTFPFLYDGAPPTANLIANYGQDTVHQTTVHLQTDASDLGSGVSKMRLSTEGYVWTDWLDYAPEMTWEIPDVGLRTYDIYFQVQDLAGNLSEIVTDTVYLDVNVPRPHSETYDLWDQTLSAGWGVMTSTAHLLTATAGQGYDAPVVAGQQYQLVGGYQAGAQAAPTTVVSATQNYVQLGSVLASGGSGDTPLQSASYAMYGTLGQPSDMQVVTGTQYVASLGFWGGVADTGPGAPPPPPPPPPAECEFYSVSIDNGALFTNQPQVNLNLCGPGVQEMMVSNDGGFGSAVWQPYTRTLTWTLTTYGNYVLPRNVYVRFRDTAGNIHGNFMDDIIYDPTAPSGQAAFDPVNLLGGMYRPATVRSPMVVSGSQADMFISAMDDSSGLSEMQVSLQPDFSGASWQPYSSIVPVSFTQEGLQTVYLRFRDRAQNESQTTSTSVIVDSTPPTAVAAVREGIVGADAISVTLAVTATDTGSGVTAMRIGSTPAMTDSIWMTYTLETPVYVTYTGQTDAAVYVQVRDAAGNESPVYAASYQMDVTPPSGTVTVAARGTTTATLRFQMQDDLSGVSQILLSPDAWFFENVTALPYQAELTWDFGSTDTVYIVFVDGVGNWSEPYMVRRTSGYDIYLPLIQH